MTYDNSGSPNRGAKAKGAYHHGDLRPALIAAALSEVERVGPGAISLSSLAKSLGVSQPAPYRHFADREALLVAVAMEGFGLYDREMATAVGSASRFTAPGKIAQAHVSFGLAHPGLYRLMFATPWSEGPNAPVVRSVAGAFDHLLEAVRAMGYGQGARRKAMRIWAASHGLVMLAAQASFAEDFAEARLGALVEDIIS